MNKNITTRRIGHESTTTALLELQERNKEIDELQEEIKRLKAKIGPLVPMTYTPTAQVRNLFRL